MKDLLYDRTKEWEIVMEDHLDLDNLTCGTLYRYPIFSEVPAGETVTDGWSQPHTAPNSPGTYTLYQYVQDATLQGFRWVRE